MYDKDSTNTSLSQSFLMFYTLHPSPAGDTSVLVVHHATLGLHPLEVPHYLGDGEKVKVVDRIDVREKNSGYFVRREHAIPNHPPDVIGAGLVEAEPLPDDRTVVGDGARAGS